MKRLACLSVVVILALGCVLAARAAARRAVLHPALTDPQFGMWADNADIAQETTTGSVRRRHRQPPGPQIRRRHRRPRQSRGRRGADRRVSPDHGQDRSRDSVHNLPGNHETSATRRRPRAWPRVREALRLRSLRLPPRQLCRHRPRLRVDGRVREGARGSRGAGPVAARGWNARAGRRRPRRCLPASPVLHQGSRRARPVREHPRKRRANTSPCSRSPA